MVSRERKNHLTRFSIQLNCKWVDLRLFNMILNERIALGNVYCFLWAHLIAKVVTKKKQLEQKYYTDKVKSKLLMNCQESIENKTGSVFFCINCNFFITPLCFSLCYYLIFIFFVFTCTQNAPKQLKIKEISPHKESFCDGIEKPIFDWKRFN